MDNKTINTMTIATLLSMTGTTSTDMAARVRNRLHEVNNEKTDLEALLTTLESSPSLQVQKVGESLSQRLGNAIPKKLTNKNGKPSKKRTGLTHAVMETVRLSKKPMTVNTIALALCKEYGSCSGKKFAKFTSSVYSLCAQMYHNGILDRNKDNSTSYVYSYIKQ